jgi:hypothetical protein
MRLRSFDVKNIELNKLFNVAALIPAVIGLMSAAFMGYAFWWPVEPAYKVIKADQHAVTYDLNSNTIRIHRFYCVTSGVPITISRDLIGIPSRQTAAQLRISLPQTVQTYELGCHEIDRIFEVPKGTPAGNYRLVNIATWKANPFREGTAKLPELYLAIPAP